MTERKRSWLDGPAIPSQADELTPPEWPGEKLGLPKAGPGSLASVMRRAFGVLIDWTICYILAILIASQTDALGGAPFVTYMLFPVISIITVTLFARTPGQAMLGMGVARIDNRTARVGFWRACVRALATCLLFPAVLVDADGRGLHDRSTGTSTVMG